VLGKRFSLTAVAALATLALASCVGVDYDGDKKAPKMKRSDVQVFFDKSKIPVKDYRVMGSAEASGSSSYSASEVEIKLIDYAKECGADGVLILSVDMVPDGVVRDDQIYNNGDEHAAKGRKEEAYKVTVKAQFLEFPKSLDDEAQPAAPAAASQSK